MIFCENCGKQLEKGQKFCDGCGKSISAQDFPLPAASITRTKESKSLSDAVKIACLNCGSSQFKETGGKKFCVFCGTEYLTEADVEVDTAGRKAKVIAEVEVDTAERKAAAIVKGGIKGFLDVGSSIITKAETVKRSRSLAFVFAIFLGTAGVHHFYLGYSKKGIISIIMSCTLIGLIISFPCSIIDAVRIITGSYKPKNGEYE